MEFVDRKQELSRLKKVSVSSFEGMKTVEIIEKIYAAANKA